MSRAKAAGGTLFPRRAAFCEAPHPNPPPQAGEGRALPCGGRRHSPRKNSLKRPARVASDFPRSGKTGNQPARRDHGRQVSRCLSGGEPAGTLAMPGIAHAPHSDRECFPDVAIPPWRSRKSGHRRTGAISIEHSRATLRMSGTLQGNAPHARRVIAARFFAWSGRITRRRKQSG